jgi:hypothetical protein
MSPEELFAALVILYETELDVVDENGPECPNCLMLMYECCCEIEASETAHECG